MVNMYVRYACAGLLALPLLVLMTWITWASPTRGFQLFLYIFCLVPPLFVIARYAVAGLEGVEGFIFRSMRAFMLGVMFLPLYGALALIVLFMTSVLSEFLLPLPETMLWLPVFVLVGFPFFRRFWPILGEGTVAGEISNHSWHPGLWLSAWYSLRESWRLTGGPGKSVSPWPVFLGFSLVAWGVMLLCNLPLRSLPYTITLFSLIWFCLPFLACATAIQSLRLYALQEADAEAYLAASRAKSAGQARKRRVEQEEADARWREEYRQSIARQLENPPNKPDTVEHAAFHCLLPEAKGGTLQSPFDEGNEGELFLRVGRGQKMTFMISKDLAVEIRMALEQTPNIEMTEFQVYEKICHFFYSQLDVFDEARIEQLVNDTRPLEKREYFTALAAPEFTYTNPEAQRIGKSYNVLRDLRSAIEFGKDKCRQTGAPIVIVRRADHYLYPLL